MRFTTLTTSLLLSITATISLAQSDNALEQSPTEPTAEQIITQPAQPRQDLIVGLEDRRWYPTTGRDLLSLIDGCEEASCMSFVAGTLTGLAAREFSMGRDNPFCAGDNVATQDIRDALNTVIGNDPELQRMPVAFGILATFSVTWPCEGTQDPIAEAPSDSQFSITDMTQLDPGSILTVFENYPGALTLGNLAAPTVQTIVVFHDPNCGYCADFKRETYALANTGWKVIVMPVGILGENSIAYSAMMYALAQTRPDVVEALYVEVEAGTANVEKALEVAEKFDISAAQMLGLVSQTRAYESVTANNELFDLLGAQGTPAWLISDYIYTGIQSSSDIIRMARDIPVPPGQVGVVRPGLEDNNQVDPIILPENTGNTSE